MDTTIVAILLGILEGLTEFIPVSSTGHLLLVGHFMGFDSAGNTFEVVIQIGAVLALVFLYFQRLWGAVATAPTDPASRKFIVSIVIAAIPAVLLGVLMHDLIKTVLFETPMLIAVMLVLGGVVLVLVDRLHLKETYTDPMRLPLKTALGIGLFQCLSLIPGTSRSGSTIVGALLLGVSKRAAAEFSFFLSIPMMFGVFGYDLMKNRDVLDFTAVWEIALGLAAAFITALIVVRWVLNYLSSHGYALFGWWRIIVGGVSIALLSMGV
ncbi:undecaprenyl-diphosphate phosphatase [Yoonia sp. MH D7]